MLDIDSGSSRLGPYRLAAKLAMATGLVALVSAALIGLLTGFDWTLVILPAMVSMGTYWAAGRMLGRRIDLARSVLKEIRRHQFDNLEAAHFPKGDELNDLIWQVYRTGQVLESEMKELRQVEDYRKEFLGNVSHELKTPIFAIRGFAETLLNGALADPTVNRSFLEKILRNSDRLSFLARDLSDISRIETGELKMESVPFPLRPLVRDVLESLEPIGRSKSVTLVQTLSEALPRVQGDPEHIRQVIVNLVDNAVKYNNPGGVVEIRASAQPNGYVKVSVTDNGIGVPPEHISRLTERFFRVDKSRSRSQGGTGLGLAIVKHILAAHGATLSIESRPGLGSTFSFSLPIAVTPVP